MNEKKIRLDQAAAARGLVATRSQAESYIKLGKVSVNGRVVTKPGALVGSTDKIVMLGGEQYVSRAAFKLASVADVFSLNFREKIVLDVGSSTGGFSDYALRRGAKKVVAVEIGTNQLHPTLRGNPKIELREQTDIRSIKSLKHQVDIVVIDVSFISLREILPHVSKLIDESTQVVAMVKPQFEAGLQEMKHKGVIKNESMRREILKDFEGWVKQRYKIINKADSMVSGEKGNQERFYLLAKLG